MSPNQRWLVSLRLQLLFALPTNRRQPQEVDLGAAHIGFRTVLNAPGQ